MSIPVKRSMPLTKLIPTKADVAATAGAVIYLVKLSPKLLATPPTLLIFPPILIKPSPNLVHLLFAMSCCF